MTEDANEEAQQARRNTLRAYIDKNFATSVNAFADALGRSQPQLNEMLTGRRSFGEKMARSLEAEIDQLRKKAEGKNLPPLRFGSTDDTHPKLAMLIRHFVSIPTEENQDLLIKIAGTMANKGGDDAASTQVERDIPAPGLGGLQPGNKPAPKKRRRA